MRLTGVKKTYEGEYLSGYNLEYDQGSYTPNRYMLV